MESFLDMSSRSEIFSKKAIVLKSGDFDTELIASFHKTVWINGCFDLIHRGHLSLIRQAASSGDCLIIGVNSDESVKNLKGPKRPINDENERALALSENAGVNFVVIFPDDSPLNVLQKIRPHIVLKDFFYSELKYPERDYLESINCEIRYLDHIVGLSTTEIEKKISDSTKNEC